MPRVGNEEVVLGPQAGPEPTTLRLTAALVHQQTATLLRVPTHYAILLIVASLDNVHASRSQDCVSVKRVAIPARIPRYVG
jgi:hypothetical protein